MSTIEDVRNMREDEINQPVNWLCVDCGVNTAPGLSTRAEMYKAFVIEGKESLEQKIDWQSELYVVRNVIWAKAGMEPFGGCLCIGCLEGRLRRSLKPKDFDHSHPFNRPDFPATDRLLNRRGRRKGGRCYE
jgi:hypothetical protein